jgi:F-type H+-transporting ATPase subunit a
MIFRFKRVFYRFILFIFSFLLISIGLTASETEKAVPQEESTGQKSFNAGDFIFDHIKDAYEWHIITWKGHHVSIPLPVIVYSRQSGGNVRKESDH